jgi:hypothetical protein
MIDKSYRCDLCRERISEDAMRNDDAVGLYWIGKIIMARAPLTVERHLCVYCLSSIQAMEKRCGQGFKCTGGPECGSDHK